MILDVDKAEEKISTNRRNLQTTYRLIKTCPYSGVWPLKINMDSSICPTASFRREQWAIQLQILRDLYRQFSWYLRALWKIFDFLSHLLNLQIFTYKRTTFLQEKWKFYNKRKNKNKKNNKIKKN